MSFISTQYQKLAKLPMSLFSTVLGLAAFSLALRYGASIQILNEYYGQVIGAIAIVFWIFLIIGYLSKWSLYKDLARDEFFDKILCCFASLIPITTMLVGILLLPVSKNITWVLAIVGTIAQIAFSAYRNAGLWRGTHEQAATTPIVYLPAVASNLVSSMIFVQLGQTSIGWIFFGAAIFSWISIEPAILQRLRNLAPIAPEKRPILGIQLAPAFVAGNAYLQLQQGNMDIILLGLIGYGLVQFIYLLRLSPWIFEKGFTMSAWAFSFGLASMVNVGLHLVEQAQETSIVYLGWSLTIVGSVLVSALLIFTLWRLLKNIFTTK